MFAGYGWLCNILAVILCFALRVIRRRISSRKPQTANNLNRYNNTTNETPSATALPLHLFLFPFFILSFGHIITYDYCFFFFISLFLLLGVSLSVVIATSFAFNFSFLMFSTYYNTNLQQIYQSHQTLLLHTYRCHTIRRLRVFVR